MYPVWAIAGLGWNPGFAWIGAVDAVGGSQAIQVVVGKGLTAGATELAGRRHGEGVPQPQDVADGVVLVGQGCRPLLLSGALAKSGQLPPATPPLLVLRPHRRRLSGRYLYPSGLLVLISFTAAIGALFGD